ncbi:MAG: flagellar motor switch protein FliM [Acidobacteriota bacterium]
MSEKVLSQEEISALLDSVNQDTFSEEMVRRRRKGRRIQLVGEGGYLFPISKTTALNREVESALGLIFDAFSHKAAATLSTTLRTQVSFKLHDVEQVGYADYLESLPEPSSMWYLEVEPHKLHVAVCLEPKLVHTLISVMLGGGHMTPAKNRPYITDLEQTVIESIIVCFCKELRHAWSRVSEVDIKIDNRETRPRLLRIYPPSETMVVVGMSMETGSTEADMYWGVPGSLLRTLQRAVSQQRQVESREKLVEVVRQMASLALRFDTAVEVNLGVTKVSVGDLLSLKRGDVLTVDHPIRRPVLVTVNKSLKYTGELVASNDHKAVRIGARHDRRVC